MLPVTPPSPLLHDLAVFQQRRVGSGEGVVRLRKGRRAAHVLVYEHALHLDIVAGKGVPHDEMMGDSFGLAALVGTYKTHLVRV